MKFEELKSKVWSISGIVSETLVEKIDNNEVEEGKYDEIMDIIEEEVENELRKRDVLTEEDEDYIIKIMVNRLEELTR